MTATRLTVLPLTEYGIPSGNYDGTNPSFSGNPVTAAAYYRAQGLQTVRYDLTEFDGNIVIEATLDSAPSLENINWFPVYEILTAGTPITASSSADVVGNFTWIRARVSEFTAGAIDTITLVY